MATLKELNAKEGDKISDTGGKFTYLIKSVRGELTLWNETLGHYTCKLSESEGDWYDLVSRAKPTITLGQTYKTKRGDSFKCVGIVGEKAYMALASHEGVSDNAYGWSLDGVSSLGADWDVEWGPVVETVEVHQTGCLCVVPSLKDEHYFRGKLTVTTIDGKPDWSTIKIEGEGA